MDEQTARFYATHAHETVLRYEGVSDRELAIRWLAWKPGVRVLDVGCGSGRDLALLARLGCDVWGVEPGAEFRAELATLHPELEGRIAIGVLPDLGSPFGGGFDSVLCSAVLMHLPGSGRPRALASLGALIAPGGRLQVSWMAAAPNLDAFHRHSDGRLFTPIPVEALVSEADAVGLRVVSVEPGDDPWGRPGVRWLTARFVAS